MQQDKDAPRRAQRGAGKRDPEEISSGHDGDQLDAATRLSHVSTTAQEEAAHQAAAQQ